MDNGLCPPFCLGKNCPPALTWMPASSVPPCMALVVPLKLLPWCWSSEGANLSKSLCESFKRTCLGFQKFLPPTQSALTFTARSCGDLSSWHWDPGLEGLVWDWDSSLLRYPFHLRDSAAFAVRWGELVSCFFHLTICLT